MSVFPFLEEKEIIFLDSDGFLISDSCLTASENESPRTAIRRPIESVALPFVMPQPKHMPRFDSVHTWKELPPCSGQYHLWASFCEGLDPSNPSTVSIRTCRAFMMRLLSIDDFIWVYRNILDCEFISTESSYCLTISKGIIHNS